MSEHRYADWDAAYLLGALDPLERREFERHKADCARCAAAVEELAGMPGLLARVPQSAGRESLTPDRSEPVPASVLTGLLAAARRRRLRARLVASGLAAAAVLAVAVGVTASSQRGHRPAAVELVQLVASPVHADVRFASESWGTRIDLTCTYQGDGGASKPESAAEPHGYVLVVTDRAGNRTLAGSWHSGAGTTVSPTGSVGVALKDIAQVQISSSSGTPLLQLNR